MRFAKRPGAGVARRPALTAALEAQTPAGFEDDVAIVRRWSEMREAGENPYQDPDFLQEYDQVVRNLWEHCGR